MGTLIVCTPLRYIGFRVWLHHYERSGSHPTRANTQSYTTRSPPAPLAELDAWLSPYRELWSGQLDALAAHLDNMPDDALRQAMNLWAERKRARAELVASLDAAESSLARGEGREITEESMRQLAEDVRRRGLARLAAEHSGSR